MRHLYCLLFALFACSCVRAQSPTFSFLTAEQNEFVAAELRRLTLKQKAGQMTQVAVDLVFEGQTYVLTVPPVFSDERLNHVIGEREIGSILNVPSRSIPTPAEYREYIGKIQEKAMQTTGVPVLYGQDAIHGANYVRGSTLYAQPLGVAASFNTELATELASLTAYELKAASIPWNFSPAMDAGRHPAWPRTWECFGEDTYVNQQFGLAALRGYQGDGVNGKNNVVACLKHFTGYGATASGHDRTPAYLPERQLREYYLPQFQAAIDSGALTVMINSGEINGIPVHTSKRLLTDILRDEMGFEGLLVSDWQDVRYLYERHHVANDLKEAVRMAIDAGMDMSMTAVTTDFPDVVVELVQEGQLTEGRIDTSVARVLAVKVALGLYEQHLWEPEEFPEFGGQRFARKAQQSAEEAIVLLKNDGLPLPIDPEQRILVVGPTADNMRSLNGGWTYSWQGQEADRYLQDHNTIREAIQKQFPGRVTYAPGATMDSLQDVATALSLARESDIIVLCLGESSYTEDPGNINSLVLPSVQRRLFDELHAVGKPIVLVMAAGRPRLMTSMANRSRAVLFAPYPGPYGGDAIASVLAGRVNPSGRLPLTYPRHPNALVSYDHKATEARNGGYNPLFEFGYGLSYTDFVYSDLRLSSRVMNPQDTLEVSLRVTNEGQRAGKHSILLYTSDLVASVTPSVQRLRKFTKVHLEPGENEVITFRLTPADIAFIGRDDRPTTEPGTFRISIGNLTEEFDFEAR
ncbi:glycoside hydrolase family 3 N-terminal domain-containing protein [Lewinella sp. JB7]|uniref:glycoside hydrolase family 3 N-terminal domain-containing protein n=1 Tax=Lewinella sp. JB7 TaxID=2962887 RepID=UPI0020C99331|nr:glycoside hydrolase family 3 N-terminal domain-containing protein [Lewinella sp. JB7]MCP9235380.1 glycoside hydrolase family 3 C-terminal domain-containing protein [Lewinella sp. JB7]